MIYWCLHIYGPIPFFLAKSRCQASRLEMGPVGGSFTWASRQDSASQGRNLPAPPSAGQIYSQSLCTHTYCAVWKQTLSFDSCLVSHISSSAGQIHTGDKVKRLTHNGSQLQTQNIFLFWWAAVQYSPTLGSVFH